MEIDNIFKIAIFAIVLLLSFCNMPVTVESEICLDMQYMTKDTVWLGDVYDIMISWHDFDCNDITNETDSTITVYGFIISKDNIIIL